MAPNFKDLLRQSLKRPVITGGLEASWLMKCMGLMRQAAGRGTIFTLHHVRPGTRRAFHPNEHLEVTPEFLEAAIKRLKADGHRFVALDAIPALLREDTASEPFVAFTLDDGYRDNARYAAPVFTRHGVPFTVFVNGGFAERTHIPWWEAAAELLFRTDRLVFDFGHGPERLDVGTPAQKHIAFDRLAAFIIGPTEAEAIATFHACALSHGFDPLDMTRALTMDRRELQALAANPLASLGAHTISHRSLAHLSEADARGEIEASADYIRAITGQRPLTLAYPYGENTMVSAREHRLAAEMGFAVAVTTVPGIVTRGDTRRMTGLPRISLNGFYQKPRYASALASGIPFRLMGCRG